MTLLSIKYLGNGDNNIHISDNLYYTLFIKEEWMKVFISAILFRMICSTEFVCMLHNHLILTIIIS